MAEPLEIEASPKIPRELKAHKVLKTYNEDNVKWSFTSLLKKQTFLTFKQFISVSYKICRMDAFISHSAIDAKRNLNNSCTWI